MRFKEMLNKKNLCLFIANVHEFPIPKNTQTLASQSKHKFVWTVGEKPHPKQRVPDAE